MCLNFLSIYLAESLLLPGVFFFLTLHESYKRDARCVSQGSPVSHHITALFPQLIDITGKDQDESMIALHDCNGDVNRAINVLLEGSPDTVSIGFV